MIRRQVFVVAAFAVGIAACDPGSGRVHPPRSSYQRSKITFVGRTTQEFDAATVTEKFFADSAIAPIIGRYFVPADFVKDAIPVVVLGYAFWDREFQRIGNVIGSTIDLNGRRTTVVGVAPLDYDKLNVGKFWLPRTH